MIAKKTILYFKNKILGDVQFKYQYGISKKINREVEALIAVVVCNDAQSYMASVVGIFQRKTVLARKYWVNLFMMFFILILYSNLHANIEKFKTVHLKGKLDPPNYVLQVTKERIIASKLPFYSYQIVKEYKQPSHKWFLEGVLLYNDSLYVSTGHFGESKLVKLGLPYMNIINEVTLPGHYFGEDITVLNGKLYQLSYKSHNGFIYDPETLKLLGNFSYKGQGWGLTTDGKYLIKSNGSQHIDFLDPEKNYIVVKTITVKDPYGDIEMLNALDYMDGKIYANVYLTPYIAIISPKDGDIVGWISLQDLDRKEFNIVEHHVPNGITHNNKKELLVGGKDFSKIYQIKLKPIVLPEK
ncbi:MAG: glutaminyl-peptide cyclotransferase [Pseudomonadota bacterium]